MIISSRIIAVIPIFVAVNTAALLIWVFNISPQSMPLILGIIAGGLVDLDNRLSGRIKNIFYTLLAFSVSSFAVQLVIGHDLYFPILITLMTFVFTMLGAVGQRYSTIAFGTLVVALYTILSYLPQTPWYINPSMILCGTLLYGAVALIVHLLFPYRPAQESIAASFLALADYLDAKSVFFDPDDIEQLEQKQLNLSVKNGRQISAFNTARNALFYRIHGQYRRSRTTKLLHYYFTAQDIHERAGSSHFDYSLLSEQLKNTDLLFRIRRLIELQAQTCRDIAVGLQQNRAYRYNPRLGKAIDEINRSFELYAANHLQYPHNRAETPHIKTLLDNLQGVDWQLRHLEQEQHNFIGRAQIHTENIAGLHNIFAVLRSHCTFQSQLFRHAVRLSIVVLFCCCIVALFRLQQERGYWILLTAVFVCQPNYSATKQRLQQRIIGTILGVAAGSLLPYMTSALEAKLGVIVLTSTLFLFFRSNNYSFSTFFITIQVLMSFDIMGFDIYAATTSRLIDTLIGSAVAWLAVSYLWPDWQYLRLDDVARQAVQSNARYLLHIIGQLQFSKGDDLKYRIVRRKTHENATALSTAIANMNNEPKKYARHLQQGFELLKLNDSLLSYISALAAYRRNMKNLHQSTDFLAHFYPAAKKIIDTLENIDQLTTQEFETRHSKISTALKCYIAESAEYQTPLNAPVRQLNMINRLLPPLYIALKRSVTVPSP